MKVVLADRERVLREGLQIALEQAGAEIVGSFGDGRSLVEASVQLRPDVVVTAAHLPDGAGAECIRRLKRDHPRLRAIVLSFSHAEADLILALRQARTPTCARSVRSRTYCGLCRTHVSNAST